MSEGTKQGEWSRPPGEEAVWTYRGYQMRGGEFNTAMVHFFRAEIARSNIWRQRLDATTNWAVITTGATISFAFTSRGAASGVDHGVIILNTLLVTVFLIIEARRYRYYELWSSRVRLMETDFYAAMLVPPFQPAPDWAETLAESLLHPRFPITRSEAFGRRLRRNYILIYILLGAAWFLKIYLHPSSATDWPEFMERAAIGGVPGWLVLSMGLLFNLLVLAYGGLTVGLRDAAGEVLPRFGEEQDLRLRFKRRARARGPRTEKVRLPDPVLDEARAESSEALAAAMARQAKDKKTRAGAQEAEGIPNFDISERADDAAERRAWFRPRAQRRSQLLTYIITGQPDAVGGAIIEKLGRGVTAIPARGLYADSERGVLLCALTVTEVAHLRAAVEAVDPRAFVIVSPVQEVLGGGFRPLDTDAADGGLGG